TFLIYPNVNKPVGSGGYVSLYVKIDNSSFIATQNEVYAWIKFLTYKSTTDTYHELHATEAQRFHLFKQEYGMLTFLEIGYYQNPAYGFIFNGGQSVFGVDIVVSKPSATWEDVAYEENILDGWPNAKENGWGVDTLIPLADIKDPSKGFLVKDTIRFEVEILAFSRTNSISN
ncbi:hypothetical protein DY000_02049651, partial [Brassica cretica]